MDAIATNVLLIGADSAHVDRVRSALAAAARRNGARFDLVPNQSDADVLARLADGSVDVILLDLSRASEQGLGTLVRLRVAAPDVPVVILTAPGDADTDASARALEAGAQDTVAADQLESGLLSRVLQYAIERQRLHATLRELSLTDELTGLYNLRGFHTLADHHLKLAHRTRGLLLARADVVGLASINDRFGHGEGDRALLAAGKILRDTFRASDVVARLRADDFAVLMLDAADEAIDVVGPRLRARVERHNADPALRHQLVIALGITRFGPGAPLELDDLLDKAARAMTPRR
jgi:two-component system, cell cycle response regulator